jgi:xanthine dehydrogenase small subunit
MTVLTRPIRFLRRGKMVEITDLPPMTTALDWLRLEEGSRGTKEGCNEGDCGACAVVRVRRDGDAVVHEPVNACILLVGQLHGAELITVEDLADDAALHPVQAAMVAHHGSQCGFCTPGIVMSLFALYQEAARPVTRADVVDRLAGNLCRCTGYRPIVDAALAACVDPPRDRFAARRDDTAGHLADIEAGAFVGDDVSFFAVPTSLEEACDLLVRHPDATILGGATDVGLWITKQLRDLPRIVWLGRVPELVAVAERDGAIELGAGVTLARAYALLAAIDPDLGEIVRRFGSEQVRAAGTVGGNVANGSPIGDLAPALIALGASLRLRRGTVTRETPIESFFVAYGKQDRARGELLTSIAVPKLSADERFRAFKVSKRFDEDISAVMGAFKARLDGRMIVDARLAFGGMAATPKRAALAEGALAGASLDDESGWQAAIDALARDFAPISDMRASAAYRLDAAQAILGKALAEIAGVDTSYTRLVGRRHMPAGAAP